MLKCRGESSGPGILSASPHLLQSLVQSAQGYVPQEKQHTEKYKIVSSLFHGDKQYCSLLEELLRK